MTQFGPSGVLDHVDAQNFTQALRRVDAECSRQPGWDQVRVGTAQVMTVDGQRNSFGTLDELLEWIAARNPGLVQRALVRWTVDGLPDASDQRSITLRLGARCSITVCSPQEVDAQGMLALLTSPWAAQPPTVPPPTAPPPVAPAPVPPAPEREPAPAPAWRRVMYRVLEHPWVVTAGGTLLASIIFWYFFQRS